MTERGEKMKYEEPVMEIIMFEGETLTTTLSASNDNNVENLLLDSSYLE